MKESPYALERELGMQDYATSTLGIGGTLRTAPEDFIVDEIPLAGKGGTTGPYLICPAHQNQLGTPARGKRDRPPAQHQSPADWLGRDQGQERPDHAAHLAVQGDTGRDRGDSTSRISSLNQSGSQTNSSRWAISKETGSIPHPGRPPGGSRPAGSRLFAKPYHRPCPTISGSSGSASSAR